MVGGGKRAVMLTPADMRRLVAELLERRMRGDYEQLFNYADPNVTIYCNARWDKSFVPDVWRGIAGFRELLRRTDEQYLPLDHEILDILVDGDRSVVRWRGEWRQHANGQIHTTDAAHFMRWENGLVVEMHEFFDAHSASTPDCVRAADFENMLTPRSPGLSRDEMERRARELVSFQHGAPDTKLVREWCAPDIFSEFVGDRTRLPYAGRHCGVETMLAIIHALRIDFEQQTIAIPEILIEDSQVAGRRRVRWRHRGTGRRGMSEIADFVRFDDGLIVELIEFRDSVSLMQMQD
jgi:ketosteroid isomerase-like protein